MGPQQERRHQQQRRQHRRPLQTQVGCLTKFRRPMLRPIVLSFEWGAMPEDEWKQDEGGRCQKMGGGGRQGCRMRCKA
jgi:hypothetical protein